jgi:RNA polymerase primary sigma factor
MPTWRDDKILELANQLTYSPADKRREPLNSAIALAGTIEPAKSYPWDFIHFRITSFQPRGHSDHQLSGKVLLADLSSLAEFLSDTLSLKIEEASADGDSVLEMEAVSRQFNVSSKTVQRWRKQGLIGLRYLHADGRRRLGFLQSAVKDFADRNRELVDRSAAFKQLTDEERRQIIELARRLAAQGDRSIKDISHQVARLMQRAPETIRYTIRNYDREHPEAAIFPEDPAAAEAMRRAQRELAAAHAQGALFEPAQPEAPSAPPAQPAPARAPTLAGRALPERIEYTPNPLFDHPDAANIILNVLPAEALQKAQATVDAGTNLKANDVYMARMPGGLPAYLALIFAQPVMPQELEIDAFRRFNFLKYQAEQLRASVDVFAPNEALLDQITALMAQASEVKNLILQSNLRVAVHVARKHQRPDRPLMELVSDATIWLMRAIEKYDFARPTRFSTYAGLAIMKNFARDRTERIACRDTRLVTGQQEALNELGDKSLDLTADALDASQLKSDLQDVIDELPDRERELVRSHYGLNQESAALSLSQIGDKLGITKARVRQLEARALRRIRHLMDARREKIREAARKNS